MRLRSHAFVGIQGQLWSETVRTSEQLDYMVFPRMMAVAERAWHEADWETETDETARAHMKLQEYDQFANTLGHKELSRLGEIDVAYRVPPPGAK